MKISNKEINDIFQDYPFIIKYIKEEQYEWLNRFIELAKSKEHLKEYAEIINYLAIAKWACKYNIMSKNKDFYN